MKEKEEGKKRKMISNDQERAVGKEGKAERGEKPRDRPGLVPLGLSVPEIPSINMR